MSPSKEQIEAALDTFYGPEWRLGYAGYGGPSTAEFQDRMGAALEAAAAIPTPAEGEVAGWKLVPVEPTEAMIRVAIPMYDAMLPESEWPFTVNLYRNMLAIAPKPPSTPKPDDRAALIREGIEMAAKVADASHHIGNDGHLLTLWEKGKLDEARRLAAAIRALKEGL